jgi:hypothetical protein
LKRTELDKKSVGQMEIAFKLQNTVVKKERGIEFGSDSYPVLRFITRQAACKSIGAVPHIHMLGLACSDCYYAAPALLMPFEFHLRV